MNEPLLSLHNVSKQYPGVLALDRVDFDLRCAETHVLFGENGAGKSTLTALIAGVQAPTHGEIIYAGSAVHFRSVRDARAVGVSAVFQEFSLVPTMTVAENLFLGNEPGKAGFRDRAALVRGARKLLADLDFPLEPGRRVSTLSRAEQQMVEIAKAFRGKLRTLILDEPTASLTDRETERIFALIERLKGEGVGIIYITHRMQEIRRVADRVTVLRDGRNVGTIDGTNLDEGLLIEMMCGRSIGEIYPKIAFKPQDTILSLASVSTAGGVCEATLYARRGEIVGIAGLVGSGKSEVVRVAFGLEALVGGAVSFKGKNINRPTPRRMLADGQFYLPPDRKDEGLVLVASARANIMLSGLGTSAVRRPFGFYSHRAEDNSARSIAHSVELALRDLKRDVAHLSGGNQQKVLFGKGLAQRIELFVFDEPTVGVDIRTRSVLYGVIQRLCEAGAAIIVVSSDLPEVLHLSHRLYVMRGGRIVAECTGDQINESTVLGYFFDGEAAHMSQQTLQSA
jgi:ribose transport system ATP-binding protein